MTPTILTKIHIDSEVHSSKNHRQIVRSGNGRTFVIKAAAALRDEGLFAEQLEKQRELWAGLSVNHSFPLRVHFYFYRQTRRRWDFANIVQGLADAMVKAGYIPDDDVGHFIPIYAGHILNKDNPGVDFWIEEEQS